MVAKVKSENPRALNAASSEPPPPSLEEQVAELKACLDAILDINNLLCQRLSKHGEIAIDTGGWIQRCAKAMGRHGV